MPRYIALLRGINVGGNTMLKMEELRRTFDALHFENVKTYINSGNIAFDSAEPTEARLTSMIEAAIEMDFARPVPVMVREQEAIGRIMSANPFEGDFGSHKEMHVLFLKGGMSAEKQEQLMAAATPPERFAVLGREIYCHLPLGVADSILGKSFIEKKLKVPVTGRNWRTVEKLAGL